MNIEERDIEEQFFKSIQFNYGKPTTKKTIMNFADLIRTDQRNKDVEILRMSKGKVSQEMGNWKKDKITEINAELEGCAIKIESQWNPHEPQRALILEENEE